jgi:hypothetical protein
MHAAFGDDFLFAFGNHDLGDQPGWSYRNCADIYVGHLEGKVVRNNQLVEKARNEGFTGNDLLEIKEFSKFTYYKDDHKNKVRYIVLNSGHYNGHNTTEIASTFSLNMWYEMPFQYDFLYDALMSVPSDYDVMVACHISICWEDDYQVTGEGNYLNVAKMLSAFKTGSSVGIVPNTRGNANAAKIYSNTTHTYDFTNKVWNGKVFITCGHIHRDASCICQTTNGIYGSQSYYPELTLADDAILVIANSCDAWNVLRSPDGGNSVCLTMTEGTITEQCFSVISWNASSVKVHRFGAGDDRIFNY